MGSNRKLPFGYKMEMGRVILHPVEYKEVQYIFSEYQKGASFKELTDTMEQKGVPYDGDKPWNKNMIARILADSRYIGESGFPQIIAKEDFDAVIQRREKKKPVIQITEAQKVLRKKSNAAITPTIENEVLRHLNSLCRETQRIKNTAQPKEKSGQETKLELELEEMLQMLPVDQTAAKDLIFRLAVSQYESIGNEEYETQRLRRIFERRTLSEELDAQLIKDTITEVIVTADGTVSIRLKNNQIIGKR